MNNAEVYQFLDQRFALKLTDAVRNVLENKHLYQAHRVEIDKFIESLKELVPITIPSGYGHVLEHHSKDLASSFWEPFPRFPGLPQIDKKLGVKTLKEFHLPTAKMYCPTCERFEPYNPVSGIDVFMPYQKIEPLSRPAHVHQQFTLLYRCQSCKTTPVVLGVAKIAWIFVNCGRYPMEHVEVPKFLPKKEAHFYGDSRIAFNSGQVLAAIFLLRTFIEQFVKDAAGTKDIMVDLAIDNYMGKLPQEFKDRFPSLRKCYEDLSVAVHNAEASSDLYHATARAIEEHFDARRLFKL